MHRNPGRRAVNRAGLVQRHLRKLRQLKLHPAEPTPPAPPTPLFPRPPEQPDLPRPTNIKPSTERKGSDHSTTGDAA